MLACWVLPYTKPRSVRHHPFKAPKSHAIRPLPPFLRFSAPFASRRDPFPAPGSSRSTAGRFEDHLNATPLRISPLECAVTSKHRVLPGFGRSCPPVTPLECAVTQIDAVTPLECALTKKGGGGGSLPRDFPISIFEFPTLSTRRAAAEYRTLPSFPASWYRPRADAVNDVRRKPLQSGEQPKRFGPKREEAKEPNGADYGKK